MIKLTRAWCSLFALFSVLLPQRGLTQITPAVGGTGTTVTVNDQQFDIGGGAFSRDGQNLFHLFQQFGLNDGQVANFLSNPGVRNILGGVNGGDVSYINGLLQVMGGNSNLYLLNPAGIVFGPNASLNVPAAFHASTAQRVHFDGGVFDISGVNDYTNLVGNPTAFEFPGTGMIINEGNLAVGAGQNLSLMGHQVINTGTLSAPGGRVTIQAVPETGMVRISQEGMILSLEFPADRIPEDGVIEAVDIPRLITGGEDRPRVNSVVENPDGSVSLVHDPSKVNLPVEGATAVVSGTLDVSTPEGMGGQINVLGQQVAIANAQLLANGPEGGGTILVGGDYLGGTADTGRLDSSLNAQNLYVDSNTVMNADAVTQGNGGTVINWADNSTVFHGTITARGGEFGGDGGFAEVSGRETLQMRGFADLRAPEGAFGTLLLDPGNITIQNGGGANSGPNSFDDGFLNPQLALGNVTIATANATNGNDETIVIVGNTSINWSEATTLTLIAGRNIVMSAGAVIQNTSANTGFDAIVFNANTAGATAGTFNGIRLNGGTLSANGGNIQLTGRGGDTGGFNRGIFQENGAQVTTTSGNITYTGTAGSATSTNSNIGIVLTGFNTGISSQSGAISLTGTGQGTGNNNYGILQQFNTPVSTTSGNITYTGTGGTATSTNDNYGIFLIGANTRITSQDGAIALTGTGQGTGNNNRGIFHQAGSISTTSGNITYIGTGGIATSTNDNYGIFLTGADTSLRSTQGGNIALTGTGQGTGNNNYGINQRSGSQVSTTGNGTITYVGRGANGLDENSGIDLTGVNTRIAGNSGNVVLTGTGQGSGNNNRGINQRDGAQVSSTDGNISYTGTGGNGKDDNSGIALTGADTSTRSTQGGNIALTGTGQGTGNKNRGISQADGAQVSTTGTGTINYVGRGANGLDENSGIDLTGVNTRVAGNSGNVVLTGNGQGSGKNNRGINQKDGAQVSSTSGNISYTGTGGNGKDENSGIALTGVDTSTRSTQGGNIALTGTGQGTGNNNRGISQADGAQVSTTDNGTINYVGRGANGLDENSGIDLTGANTRVAGNSGKIVLTGNGQGSGNNNRGINQKDGAQVSTTDGDISYTGTGANGTDDNSGIALTGADTSTRSTQGGNIALTGTGEGTGNNNRGISQADGAQVSTTGNGTITYVGRGANGLDENSGIDLTGANTRVAGNSGKIVLTGNGQGSGNNNRGINQKDGAQVSTTDGDISYTGTSGNGKDNNSGIALTGADTSTRSTQGGNIALTGTGEGTGNNNRGISQADGAQVSTTGNGAITYVGRGANGLDENSGIDLTGANTRVAGNSGKIVLTGNGQGNGNNNRGINQRDGAQVSNTGNGAITYMGTGGNGKDNNQGIALNGENTRITGNGGAIDLTGTGQGTGNNNRGISQQNGTQVSTTSGNISYTGTGGNGAEAIQTETGANRIGNGTSGDIALTSTNNAITLNDVTVNTTGNIQIKSPGNVTQNANSLLQAPGLELLGAGNFTLNQDNQISTLAANTTGTTQLTTAQNLDLGTVNSTNGITANTLILDINGDLSQSQPIAVQNLGIIATGNVLLNNPTNQIQTLGADTKGDLTVVTSTDLTIDTVMNLNGIQNANTVLLQSGGDIILNQGITATNDITLVAARNFINNAGANALQSTLGRWLVYSASPEGSQLGGLTGSGQFGLAYPGVPSFAGNGFIFSGGPTMLSLSLLSTILQGQEEAGMSSEKILLLTLCQLLEEGEEVLLEIDGVPVKSALEEECRYDTLEDRQGI